MFWPKFWGCLKHVGCWSRCAIGFLWSCKANPWGAAKIGQRSALDGGLDGWLALIRGCSAQQKESEPISLSYVTWWLEMWHEHGRISCTNFVLQAQMLFSSFFLLLSESRSHNGRMSSLLADIFPLQASQSCLLLLHHWVGSISRTAQPHAGRCMMIYIGTF